MSTVPQRGRALLLRLAEIEAPRMAEVGVWRGALATWMLTMHPTLRLAMVDRWAAVPAGHRYRLSEAQIGKAGDEKHHAAMTQAMGATSFAEDRREVYRGESIDVAEQFPAGVFDLVFIDADHTYEGVAEDIAAWWPNVRPGGWLSGHDWENQPPMGDRWGVERAVREFAESESLEIDLDADKTWFIRKPKGG